MALAGKLLLFLVYVMLCSHQSASFLSNELYPFGLNEGDTLLDSGDDISSPAISIPSPFPYYGASYSDIFVNTNGILSFMDVFSAPSLSSFPLPFLIPLIAPYFADVDGGVGGEIFYRATNDEDLLQRASNTIQLIPTQAGFSATWMFVVTWNEVPFFGADLAGILKRNTFQCVLVTDGFSSFAFFYYNIIEWTTSINLGGSSSTGLGGVPALVGFDAGDGSNAFEIPQSRTDDILSVTNLTNVGISGLFIFKIDEGQIGLEIDINECSCEQCIFGTCSELEDGINCTCHPGYTGVFCDIDIDECASNPCAFGLCTDMVNSFTCICDPGYTGVNCDIDIDECESEPCVFGNCTDMLNGFMCTCEPGYTGMQCDIDIDECEGEPCAFGNCTDMLNGFMCTCEPGYTGVQCDIDIDECESEPCVFGNCTDMLNGFMCTCEPEYTGVQCDIDIDECASSPCLFGTCTDMVNEFKCTCNPGYTGVLCDIEINECESSPCVHGLCKDAVNGYACLCDRFHFGRNCEIDINPCRSSPCKRGICFNWLNGYRCRCPWNYGSECDK